MWLLYSHSGVRPAKLPTRQYEFSIRVFRLFLSDGNFTLENKGNIGPPFRVIFLGGLGVFIRVRSFPPVFRVLCSAPPRLYFSNIDLLSVRVVVSTTE